MKRVDTATRNAAIADRLAGIPGEVVARKYGIHEASVARWMMQVKKQIDAKAEIHQKPGDYRAELKNESIKAIRAGLDPNPDKYKAGNLGIQVMKGIGEFEGDKAPVGVVVSINIPSTLAMPEGWNEAEHRVVKAEPKQELQEQSKPLALPGPGVEQETPAAIGRPGQGAVREEKQRCIPSGYEKRYPRNQ